MRAKKPLPRRTARRRQTYSQNRRSERGDFLLVTLIQCTLCVMMLAAAYFSSGLFGMTELKPAFSALLTSETDAQAVSAGLDAVREEIERLPENIFSQKVLLSVPLTQPVEGRLTSEYGFRKDVFTGAPSFHTGTDIAAAEGTAVAAAASGVVSEVGQSEVYGNYVLLSHGGFDTRYCHCSRIDVREGDTAIRGEKIAEVGSTGRSTGAHLHLELLVDGKAADLGGNMEGWTWL